MEGFPSGQREQTVNLSSMTSVVRIHHLPPKQKDIPKGMSFFCFGGRWLWIRKVALRNSPVGCFNHRGFRRNGSESTTGRVGTHVAVRLWDCTSQSRQAHAQSESQTSAPVSSLDKTQAYVIMNTRDAVTAVRPLTDQQLKVIDRSGA